jgi:hypothetical protein
MRMIRKLCLMILIAIAPASLAADVELAQRALERMSEIELNQWSYQRTLVSEDGTRIDHHDPRRAEPEHWQIVSIDGRSPTAEEIEEYNEGRETGDRKEAESKGSRDIVEMLDPGSLELQSSDDIGANSLIMCGFGTQKPCIPALDSRSANLSCSWILPNTQRPCCHYGWSFTSVDTPGSLFE